jgi:tRNA(Ile2) C34 agmatinyltransferase TiaS
MSLHWLDNADSWICPICGFETSSPAKYEGCKCPKCGFQDDKDKYKSRKPRKNFYAVEPDVIVVVVDPQESEGEQ